MTVSLGSDKEKDTKPAEYALHSPSFRPFPRNAGNNEQQQQQ